MDISREDITAAMQDIRSCCKVINRIISPNKELQPSKGCVLGRIVTPGDGTYWSSIEFPQWVRLVDHRGWHHYRFHCDQDGNFLRWSGGTSHD